MVGIVTTGGKKSVNCFNYCYYVFNNKKIGEDLMKQFKTALLLFLCLTLTGVANAYTKARNIQVPTPKIVYCDTSAGRFVLDNGSYSKMFCRYSAVMDIQNIHNCCSWAGGVFLIKQGNVICRNGTVSKFCSTQNIQKQNLDHQSRSDDSVDLSDSNW